MPVREAQAEWLGNFARGKGTMSVGSGAFEGAYTADSRFEEGEGTNPEELIAAAHAGCYSMALALGLTEAGHEPESVRTTAQVSIDKDEGGFSITRSALSTEVKAEGLDENEFQKLANDAKEGCPVSRALGAIEIDLDAKLA
jgi:osmotically inducible protein OsmC